MNNYRQTTDNIPTKSAVPETTTTSSSIATDPGVLLDPMELEEIRQAYFDLLGPLNSVKAQDIEKAIRAGLKASAILDAIEQTAMAKRPTHYYLRAILDRYAAEGIYTAEYAERRRERRRQVREIKLENRWAAWYGSSSGFDW